MDFHSKCFPYGFFPLLAAFFPLFLPHLQLFPVLSFAILPSKLQFHHHQNRNQNLLLHHFRLEGHQHPDFDQLLVFFEVCLSSSENLLFLYLLIDHVLVPFLLRLRPLFLCLPIRGGNHVRSYPRGHFDRDLEILRIDVKVNHEKSTVWSWPRGPFHGPLSHPGRCRRWAWQRLSS